MSSKLNKFLSKLNESSELQNYEDDFFGILTREARSHGGLSRQPMQYLESLRTLLSMSPSPKRDIELTRHKDILKDFLASQSSSLQTRASLHAPRAGEDWMKIVETYFFLPRIPEDLQANINEILFSREQESRNSEEEIVRVAKKRILPYLWRQNEVIWRMTVRKPGLHDMKYYMHLKINEEFEIGNRFPESLNFESLIAFERVEKNKVRYYENTHTRSLCRKAGERNIVKNKEVYFIGANKLIVTECRSDILVVRVELTHREPFDRVIQTNKRFVLHVDSSGVVSEKDEKTEKCVHVLFINGNWEIRTQNYQDFWILASNRNESLYLSNDTQLKVEDCCLCFKFIK